MSPGASNEPPSWVSDGADQNRLETTKAERATYQRSLDHMVNEVAGIGGEQWAGDDIAGFVQERAEGMSLLESEGQLEWMGAKDENCHLEVSVSDAAFNRVVPYLRVYASLTARDGQTLSSTKIPVVWHPGVYPYGRNLEVPGAGRYTLHPRTAPPTFMHYDEVNGERYAETVVTFEDVQITSGRK